MESLKKLYLLMVAFILLPAQLLASGDEHVIHDEFESYLLGRGASASLLSKEENWNQFVLMKLKAADACSRGWDTLPSFMQLCKSLQGEDMKGRLVSSSKPLVVGSFIEIEQLYYPLSQQASLHDEAQAKAYMDSVYVGLSCGKSFADFPLCRYSKGCYSSENLLQEMLVKIDNLSENELSVPFYTPLGLHIIRVLKHHAPNNQAFSRSALLKKEAVKNKDLIRLSAIRDSLLAVCWDAYHVSEVQAEEVTPDILQKFFQKYRDRYHWEFPHFKGAVICCKSKRMASRIKRYLKKVDFMNFSDAFSKLKKDNSAIVGEMQTGLFQIGKNPYVDKLVFKCGEYPERLDYPYIFVIGKRLDKGPESYQDVYSEVLEDYQKMLQEQLLQNLKQRFQLDFDSKILKTVNYSASN